MTKYSKNILNDPIRIFIPEYMTVATCLKITIKKNGVYVMIFGRIR